MGRRIELFQFTRDSTQWFKTSASSSVLYDGNSYLPAVIKRSEQESRGDVNRSDLKISLDLYDDLAQDLLSSFTERSLSLSAFKYLDTTIEMFWKGRLVDMKPNGTILIMTFESIFTSMTRPGLRAKYQKTCRYGLYSAGCTLNSADFKTAGTVTAMANAVTLTIAEAALQPDGYYFAGVLETADGTLAFIVNHVGNQLIIQRPCDALTKDFLDGGSASVYIYPGCDKTRTTCATKFSNIVNFGGFPWFPGRNPMDGNKIG